MRHKRFLPRVPSVFSVILLLAACAPSQPAATTTSPSITLLAPTLAPEPTPSPTTTTTEWDLVILSDSTLWGVGEYYAAYIQEDMNVTVKLHDLWQGSLSARKLLQELRNEERYRSIVRDAEVVVYFGNPAGTDTGDWDCIPQAVYGVRECSIENFAEYQATLEAVVEEILALRDGAATIIRATDFYIPILEQWQEVGLEAACTQCVETMNQAVHQAAAAQNVPVALVYDAFNGPGHDEDPRDKGYIGADGMHTSDLGQQVIASLLRELGYEPVVP